MFFNRTKTLPTDESRDEKSTTLPVRVVQMSVLEDHPYRSETGWVRLDTLRRPAARKSLHSQLGKSP